MSDLVKTYSTLLFQRLQDMLFFTNFAMKIKANNLSNDRIPIRHTAQNY